MKIFHRLFFILSIFVISSYFASHAEQQKFIYFYNPETSINNFATLKTAFDSYLVEQGDYHFQPFDSKSNFETSLQQGKNNIYLLSSWHLKALQQQFPLKIILIASSKGKTLQRKILSAKKDVTNMKMLKNTVIAGAGNEDYIHSVLLQILGKQHQNLLKDIKILTVPKDIDAVMAVSFGMATAAISAESSLNKLAVINPNQFQRLQSLGFSGEDYLLVAATLKKSEQQKNHVNEVLMKMTESQKGNESLKLLGIDGWKPL